MWIRSQDRTILIDAAVVYIGYHDKAQPTREIGTSDFRGDDYMVGTYASQERALEVLDEIQHAICYYKATEIMGLKMDGLSEDIINGFVYQMPAK